MELVMTIFSPFQAAWTPTSRGRVGGRAECSSSVTGSKSEKVRIKPTTNGETDIG